MVAVGVNRRGDLRACGERCDGGDQEHGRRELVRRQVHTERQHESQPGFGKSHEGRHELLAGDDDDSTRPNPAAAAAMIAADTCSGTGSTKTEVT
ncbi:hypothetical protein BJF83_01000 [Nocardiopsis sp. CNR-923]|nr:hypothetical protein BJF83_01000 [Nocardiopsis sp. CNR-923]